MRITYDASKLTSATPLPPRGADDMDRGSLDRSSLDGNAPACEPPVGWVRVREAHAAARGAPRSRGLTAPTLGAAARPIDVSLAMRHSRRVRWLFTLACLGTM